MKYGPGFVTGLIVEWENGKQVAIWPKDVAVGTLTFPGFVKTAQAAQ